MILVISKIYYFVLYKYIILTCTLLLFLEPERKLLLSEKIGNNDSGSELTAHPEFCFVGTMNPGGDYGKKEVCY